MKNLLNKIFRVSQRGTGKVEEGRVTNYELVSYDIMPEPGFPNATFSEINDIHKQIQRELVRQELLKTRMEKIDKLNNI